MLFERASEKKRVIYNDSVKHDVFGKPPKEDEPAQPEFLPFQLNLFPWRYLAKQPRG